LILFEVGLALCFTAAVLALVLTNRDSRIFRQPALIVTALGSLLLTIFAFQVFIDNKPISLVAFEIVPQLQFSFTFDRLAAIFIFLIAIVSLAVSIYSLKYIEEASSGKRRNLMGPLMVCFILSMLLFVAADNGFAQLVFWELMSLLSFFLVMFNYEKNETPKSGLFYFVMTQMSTLFLLLALVIIYCVTGTFKLQPLTSISSGLNSVIFLSLFIGFGIKAGIMPLHKWLPYAHSSSPSNISALMSGVMIKVAIYGLMRYVLDVLTPQSWWGMVILIFGTFSALMGVVYALKEHDIKRLLAYHSIENIGIILIGFGLYLIFQQYGQEGLAYMCLAAALLHTLNHAVFKSLLFLTAGSVVEMTGTRNIEKMGGLIKKMPWTAGLFLIGAIAISALPPLNGFVSELMIFQGFFQSFTLSNPFVIILLFVCLALFALTSALAAACFVKAFAIIFLAMPRSEAARQAHEVHLPMLIGPAILAVLCVVIGVGALQIFGYLGYQAAVPNMLGIGAIILVMGLLVWLVVRFTTNRNHRISETWACGLPTPDEHSEYTASGFSEPILTFFRPLYRTQKAIKRHFWDKWSSVFKDGSLEIHTLKFFEEKLYQPVVKAVQSVSNRFNKSQNVDLDTFILYSFVTIVILLIVVGWLL
jgi:hydrogenase-4 component B